MFNIIEKKINWGGRELILQTGKIARQADGAVIAKYGDTQVLATVVYSKEPKKDIDFFPLTVSYQDKFYSVGKIPGGFFKRESKPSEREVLISRLIDRPIRPLFDERFRNEVQIIVSSLSYDGENSTDIVSIVAASAALAISGIPVVDIVGSAKVGLIDGNYVLNPISSDLKNSSLELVVAGTKEGVLMVESEAQELDESEILNAVKFAHEGFSPVINLIEDFQKEVNKTSYKLAEFDTPEMQSFKEEINNFATANLTKAFEIKEKSLRKEKITEIEIQTLEALKNKEYGEDFLGLHFNYYFKSLEKNIVRNNILENGQRIDGRNLTQVRPISIELDLFPRTHGSALFTRGETQALVFTTLGTDSDEQIIDDIETDSKQSFMLHYNFPPYSVGEVGRTGAPGRREIGHGKLAWRAINPIMPAKEKFPFVIRIVSEITESNGSSSMATVCGTSLSLMAAGVPVKAPVSGVAMGLIKEGEKFAVLTDILGDEDHLGDMDFKVAGTENGITSLQMDIKITSITYEIMEEALKQAKEGRTHILNEMNKAIQNPRVSVSSYAPRMASLQINKEKIKDVIGSGGKIIKELCEVNNVKIDISQEGLVKVSGNSEEGVQAAIQSIEGLVAVPEVDKEYNGTVVKVIESGAFVRLVGNKDGFLHISALTSKRGEDINRYIKTGDVVLVKVVQIDDKGRYKLSLVK